MYISRKVFTFSIYILHNFNLLSAQHIDQFKSVDADNSHPSQEDILKLPETHNFQVLMQAGDFSTDSRFNCDFAGYVPIDNSSTKGYLSINNETKVLENCDINIRSGGVLMLDIEFNDNLKIWEVLDGTNIDFSDFEGTSKNCSGAITPWGTVISSEEHGYTSLECQQLGSNGYYKYGWQVEIDPADKQVLAKHYAMGRFRHENAAIHPNQRTIYQGADDEDGYLYKFVAHKSGDLSSGDLYVYKDDDDATHFMFGSLAPGKGKWIKIANTSINDRNRTKELAANAEATPFNELEDVEIGPEGKVYLAAAGESVVYYLEDVEPLPSNPDLPGNVNFMGVYVGNQTYAITDASGNICYESWGGGNDNLAFDNKGNLWVTQDGGEFLIWMVRHGHTQQNPKVEIFATTPRYSEPTGITFSPDNQFMFLSLQLNNGFNNGTTQLDAANQLVKFNRSTTLVIARKERFGDQFCKEHITVSSLKQSGKVQNYQALETISSSTKIWLYKNVNFNTGNAIELQNGFEVWSDSNFLAEIKPCKE